MPFSKRSLEFLFENKLNDSKDWFHEHSDDYQKFIKEPFAKLIAELRPMFHEIDNQLVCEPKCVSRIYRDFRFSRDKSTFRDNLWVTISRNKSKSDAVCFYFEISQTGFSYGCGYYQPSRDLMDAIRTLILDNDKSFKAAAKAVDKQQVFTMGGDMYKRSLYPDQSEKLCNWLNRKCIFFYADSKDFDLLFSDRLADKLKEDFTLLAPVYNFFLTAEKLALDTKLR